MGCGCVAQHQAALSAAGPRLFLHRPTDTEFVQALNADEQKDRRLLLTYFHHQHEGRFELTPQFLDLVRTRGVPHRYRWVVWRTISGWSSLYKAGAWERIAQREADPKTVDAIEKDLDRTFPNLDDFGEERKRQLADILQAFACLFPTVGYCQGMNFVAGFILLNSQSNSSEDAFFMLIQVMAKYEASLLFCDGLPLLKLYTFQFRALLEHLFPDVHRHFAREDITPELYVTKWFLTVFSQPLPFATAARLWDLIICDGLQALVHIALATIKLLRAKLLRQPTEGIMELLSLKGDTGLPSGSSIVRVALRLKKTSPCGPGIDSRLMKLRLAWARECPREAAELERASLELCTAALPVPQSHATAPSALAAYGTSPLAAALPVEPEPETPTRGFRAKVRSLRVCSSRRRSPQSSTSGAFGSTSPLLRSLPLAAEAALAAVQVDDCQVKDDDDEEEEEDNLEKAECQISGASMAIGSISPNVDPCVALEHPCEDISQERGDVAMFNIVTKLAAPSAIDYSTVGIQSSPHFIAVEAKVEMETSMPSCRPASVRMERCSSLPCRATTPMWSSSSLGTCADSVGREPSLMVQQQLPRLSIGSATSPSRKKKRDAADAAATAVAARVDSGSTGLNDSSLLTIVGPDLSAESTVAAGSSGSISSTTPLRLPTGSSCEDIGSRELPDPSPALSVSGGLSTEGSPPARQPDLGGLGVYGAAMQYSQLMSPLKEDQSPIGNVPAPSGDATRHHVSEHIRDNDASSDCVHCEEPPLAPRVVHATARTPTPARGCASALLCSNVGHEGVMSRQLSSKDRAPKCKRLAAGVGSRARSLSPQCHHSLSPPNMLPNPGAQSPWRPTTAISRGSSAACQAIASQQCQEVPPELLDDEIANSHQQQQHHHHQLQEQQPHQQLQQRVQELQQQQQQLQQPQQQQQQQQPLSPLQAQSQPHWQQTWSPQHQEEQHLQTHQWHHREQQQQQRQQQQQLLMPDEGRVKKEKKYQKDNKKEDKSDHPEKKHKKDKKHKHEKKDKMEKKEKRHEEEVECPNLPGNASSQGVDTEASVLNIRPRANFASDHRDSSAKALEVDRGSSARTAEDSTDGSADVNKVLVEDQPLNLSQRAARGRRCICLSEETGARTEVQYFVDMGLGQLVLKATGWAVQQRIPVVSISDIYTIEDGDECFPPHVLQVLASEEKARLCVIVHNAADSMGLANLYLVETTRSTRDDLLQCLWDLANS